MGRTRCTTCTRARRGRTGSRICTRRFGTEGRGGSGKAMSSGRLGRGVRSSFSTTACGRGRGCEFVGLKRTCGSKNTARLEATIPCLSIDTRDHSMEKIKPGEKDVATVGRALRFTLKYADDRV